MDNNTILTHPGYLKLKEILSECGPVAIAFSGGVDSSFLLRVAKDVLNNFVLALTALSETTARHEYDEAVKFTRNIGVQHINAETHELLIPEFIKNSYDKCYICKKHRYETLIPIAKQHGFTSIADGENLDDGKDYRPGSMAARELGVKSPLREAGLGKDTIRMLSRALGLSSWNKPSLACLASRIPFDSRITAQKLKQIDDSETFLRDLIGDNVQIRVRHFGDTARIELDQDKISGLMEASVLKKAVSCLKETGFKHVLLDLDGYRTGSLNPRITDP